MKKECRMMKVITISHLMTPKRNLIRMTIKAIKMPKGALKQVQLLVLKQVLILCLYCTLCSEKSTSQSIDEVLKAFKSFKDLIDQKEIRSY